MNNLIRKIPACFLVAVCLAVLSLNVPAQADLEPLTIRTADGREINYQVEIANTDASRRRGLMYRKEMPSNHGMLLDFGAPSKVSIWMKNTFLPLDIIYIDEDGVIAKIVTGATPMTTALMNSDTRVRAVLELNAGQVDYHGVAAGDMVEHPAFSGQ